jgi:hypothetical protein
MKNLLFWALALLAYATPAFSLERIKYIPPDQRETFKRDTFGKPVLERCKPLFDYSVYVPEAVLKQNASRALQTPVKVYALSALQEALLLPSGPVSPIEAWAPPPGSRHGEKLPSLVGGTAVSAGYAYIGLRPSAQKYVPIYPYTNGRMLYFESPEMVP